MYCHYIHVHRSVRWKVSLSRVPFIGGSTEKPHVCEIRERAQDELHVHTPCIHLQKHPV